MRRLVLVLLVMALAGLGYWLWRQEEPPATGRFSVQGLLGGALEDYARADRVRPLRFPRDHGAHPDYRSEWWYLTGNLEDEAGRRYGFQFTIFRLALSPQPRPGSSAWGTRQAYMGHFAVTDVAGGGFYAFERFSRGALGLAGGEAQPFRVWLHDWQLRAQDDGSWPWLLQAAEVDVELRLELEARKPLALQGERGLSRKGPEPGNASYYYSFTNLAAAGELRLGEKWLRVSGTAWLDREWSTSLLSPEVQGWDWFALQLDDGSEFMLYQLRAEDGIVEEFGAGLYVPPEGEPRVLDGRQFRLEPIAHWTSPRTRTVYPIVWRAQIPDLQATLRIEAAIPNQELDLSVRYWEGAVDVHGSLRQRTVQGRGYLEMTGYGGDRPPSR